MRKNKLILLQLITAFMLISTSVYAALTTTITLSIAEAVAFRGETVDVTLSLEDVDSDKKIQSVAGYINYDENVIEALNVDSIQKDENNTVTIGNEILRVEDLTDADVNQISTSSAYIAFNGNPTSDNDSRIVIDFKDGISEDADLLTIKFKVKSTATLGEVEDAISYSMFVATAGSEETEEITRNIKVTVKAVGNDEEDGNNVNNVIEENNVSNENSNSNTNGNTNTNTNTNSNRNTNTNSNTNTNRNTNTNSNTNTNTNINRNNNTNTNTNTNKNSNTNTNKNKNTNTNTNKNTNTDGTVAGTKLPATGAKVIIIPAIILIVVAYVSYNKYIKYKDI